MEEIRLESSVDSGPLSASLGTSITDGSDGAPRVITRLKFGRYIAAAPMRRPAMGLG